METTNTLHSTDACTATLAAAADLRALGHDASVFKSEVLWEHGIAAENYDFGLFTPEDSYFVPSERIEHFAAVARDEGATFRTDTEIIGI